MEVNDTSNTTVGPCFVSHPCVTEKEGQDVKMLAMSYMILKIGKSFKYIFKV